MTCTIYDKKYQTSNSVIRFLLLRSSDKVYIIIILSFSRLLEGCRHFRDLRRRVQNLQHWGGLMIYEFLFLIQKATKHLYLLCTRIHQFVNKIRGIAKKLITKTTLSLPPLCKLQLHYRNKYVLFEQSLCRLKLKFCLLPWWALLRIV